MIGAPLFPNAVASMAAGRAERGANIDRIRRLARLPITSLELDVSGDDGRRCARPHQPPSRTGSTSRCRPPAWRAGAARLVVMDVDSTLIQDEVIELLAAHAGRDAEVAEVTERAMRGEIDFTMACTNGSPAWPGCPSR